MPLSFFSPFSAFSTLPAYTVAVLYTCAHIGGLHIYLSSLIVQLLKWISMSQQEINEVYCIVCIYNFKQDVVVEWGLPIVSECEEHMRAYKLHTYTETVHNSQYVTH